MAPRTTLPSPFQRTVATRLAAVATLVSLLFGTASAASAQAEPEAPVESEAGSETPAESSSDPASDVAPEVAPVTDADADADGASAADAGAVDPPPESEAPTEPLDPMSNEAPGEEAPATDITVPPQDTYEGQEAYEPPEILWSSVAAADKKLDDAAAAKRSAISEVRRLRKRLKELQVDQQALDAESVATVETLLAASDRLRERAVAGYQWFGSGSTPTPESSIADYADVIETQRRSKLVDTALVVGEADIAEVDALRESLNGDAVALLDRTRVVADHLSDAEGAVNALSEEAQQAEIEFEAFKAGSEVFIHGVVFPIAGAYSPIIDSFGFPRMPGTPDEHWHEGIDLFAERGTPLVATERGVITKVGSGRLGGLKFWLKGESGSEWYYAHLDAFAPGLVDGLVVEAGQLVGYVGDTGNAVGTPPHLHMQLHPDGGRPVNPYPLLQVVSDIDQAAIATGTHPGYEYESLNGARPLDVAQLAQLAEQTPEPAPPLAEPADPAEPTEAPVAADQNPAAAVAESSNADALNPDALNPDASNPDVSNPDALNLDATEPAPTPDAGAGELDAVESDAGGPDAPSPDQAEDDQTVADDDIADEPLDDVSSAGAAETVSG